jgi:hypothetical protein
VPNQEATPRRTLRIPDEIWEEALRIARDRGETVTDVVLRALKRYIREFGEDER